MAIIGYGGMAGYHHDIIKEQFPQLEVAGAYDIREEAVKKAQSEKIKIYNSPKEIYDDREIDLVLIATPNDVHKSYSIDCLQAGKNVICEKPVTMNAEELEEIMKVEKSSGKFFTVHQNRRWDRDFLIVKKIFSDSLLNDPYIIESRVQGSRQSLHGWRGWKQNGGGMILDWGVHLIDQMLDFIPQKVVSVNSILHQIFSTEVEDNFTASFRFENGLHYIVNIGMNCFITQPRWHISAYDGTAIVENWDCKGKIVKLTDAKTMEWAEDIIYTAAGPTRSMAPRPKETTKEVSLPEVSPSNYEYYKNIVDVLEGKASVIVKPEEALRVMKLIDLLFVSEKEKHGVACCI